VDLNRLPIILNGILKNVISKNQTQMAAFV